MKDLTPRARMLWSAGVALTLVLIALLGFRGQTLFSYALAATALFLLALGVWEYLRRRKVIMDFRREYGAAGKEILLVYSDSPHWKEYIEANWVPRWSDRMVVFNKSKPWSEQQVEARLWRQEAGDLEHTPVVILVPPGGATTIVRFWLAFRDHKHGKDSRLKEAEQRLEQVLGK